MIIGSLTHKVKQYFNHYCGLNKAIWKMMLLNFINSIILSICYFLPIYFVNKLHLSITTSGFIISFYGIGTIFGGMISGKLSDKISSVILCAINLGMQGIAFILLLFVHSPLGLTINLAILGMATYGFITTNYISTLSLCKNNEIQRLKAINILDTSANFGLGIAALIIGFLPTNNMQHLFLSAGILLISICVFLCVTIKHSSAASHGKDVDTNDNVIIQYYNKYPVYYVLICLFIAGLIISQLSGSYSIHISLLFPTNHSGYFGMIFAINIFLVVLFQTPLSNYISKYNHVLIASNGVFLLGFGMFLLVFSTHVFFIIFSCMIYTFGEMLFFSMAQSICYENTPREKKGNIIGIYRMIYASSRVVGPATGSYIYQQFGSAYLWYSCGIVGSLCLITAIYFKNSFKEMFECSRIP